MSNAKKNRPAFRLILSNSKTHSEEAATNRIYNAVNAVKPGSIGLSDAIILAAKVHVHGSATIIKGTRKECRLAAKTIREAAGDSAARSILASRPVWDTLKWDAPMKTTIVR